MASDANSRVSIKLGGDVVICRSGTKFNYWKVCSWLESIPQLYTVEKVNQSESREILNVTVRQSGFQETNIVNMVIPITKLAMKVNNIQELSDSLVYAYFISQQDRSRSSLIDIPRDA